MSTPVPPLPTIEEQIKQASGQAGEPPKVTPDEYIEKRNEAKREKRGGVQVRIDKLTKEAAEARKEADAAKKEAEEAKKLAEQAKSLPVPNVAAAVPTGDSSKPDPRPKRDDFADESEFTTKVAEWVVRQQNKILAKPAESPKPEDTKEITFDSNNPEHVRLKTEFDGFLSAGQEFIKVNPDFTDRLNAAAAKGLTLDNMAQKAIIKLKAPQVLYYLADPANEAQARALMAMDAVNQIVQVGLIHDKLQVKASDYVSNAPRPGTQHLTNGNTRATIPRDKLDPDSYIQTRKQEMKARGQRVRF